LFFEKNPAKTFLGYLPLPSFKESDTDDWAVAVDAVWSDVISTKEELARNRVRASSQLISLCHLVAIVMMIPVVTVIAVPVIVRTTPIAVVSIRPVVSIWIIAVSIRRIVAIPIARITEPDSN
jgi:hypothetical protein